MILAILRLQIKFPFENMSEKVENLNFRITLTAEKKAQEKYQTEFNSQLK